MVRAPEQHYETLMTEQHLNDIWLVNGDTIAQGVNIRRVVIAMVLISNRDNNGAGSIVRKDAIVDAVLAIVN